MKSMGIILLILSVISLAGAFNSAFVHDVFNSTHEFNKASGEFPFAFVVLGLGFYLFRRGDQNRNRP